MKKFYIIIAIFIGFVCQSQVLTFDKIIAQNKITNFENQQLIMIDFWATWCAPCIVATEQLEYFQKKNSDKIFVVSLSDESGEKVEKFLKRNPIQLMVAVDFSKDHFSSFAVLSRPFAVVVDLNGKQVWKGHPSDFSQKTLDNLLKKAPFRPEYNSIEKVFSTKIIENAIEEIPYDGKILIEEAVNSDEIFVVDLSLNKISFQGFLTDLYGKIYNVTSLQVANKILGNKKYSFQCTVTDWNENRKKIIAEIENKLQITSSNSNKLSLVKNLVIKNNDLLWNTNQINWDGQQNDVLIGSDRITASNISIFEMSKILSKIKNKIYYFDNSIFDLHDWDLHYLYDDLMIDEFESSFGILIEDKTIELPFYKIESR
jgi:thiol-disulfide isomerase/thioredoxin